MKSLFNRKPSITSSSGSSFSNTSHYSQSSLIHLNSNNNNNINNTAQSKHNHKKNHPTRNLTSQRRPISPEITNNTRDLTTEFEGIQDHDDIITDNCPVCIEDLRMKLMGEKPLVIPKCGHRLHASCFEAVYGSLEEARRTGDVLGLCGICRKDMRLVSSGTGTFIAKTLDRNLGDHHPSQKRSKSRSQAAHTVTTANHKIHSITRKTLAPTSLDMFDDESDFEEDAQLSESELEREDELLGPWNELDPSSHQSRLLHPGGLESLRIEYKRQQSGKGRAPVKPNVTVLAENPNLFLNKDSDQSQHLTCMVTIELPSLYVAATNNSNSSQLAFQLSSPATCPSPLSPTSLPPKPSSDISPHGNPPTFPGSQLTYHPLSPPPSAVNPHPQVPPQLPTSARSPSARSVMLSPASRQQQHTEIPRDKARQPSDRSGSVGSVKSPLTRQSSMNFIPPLPVHHDHLPPLPLNGSPSQPLQPILDDLLDRMEDWKGHSSKDFGILMKCDQIYVEKEANCRQFLVYLFEEALLCVSPVRTDSITQGWSNITTTQHDNARSSGCLVVGCPLKLKGRVYIRHMNSVSVIANDPNVQFLRVKMKDEKMDAFTMRFDDVNQLEDWYSTLYSLIEKQQQRDPSVVVLSPSLNSPMHLPEIDCSNTGYIPTTPLSMPPTPVASQPTGIPHVDRDLPFQIPGNSSRSSRSDSLQSSSDLRYIDVGMTTGGSTTKTSLVTSVSTLSSVGEESAEGTPGNQEFCNVFQSAQPSSSSSHCLPSSSQMNPAFRSASLRHDFRPIDLALVISIPFPEPAGSPNSSPSSVKLRLLKQSLQFLVYHLHPRSRLSLVAFTVGNSVGNARHTGQLFYTPFLCVGKATSLKRIEFAIEQISRAGRTEGILTAQNWKYFGEDIVVSQQAADSTGFGSAILQSNHPSLIQDKVQRRLRMLERREEKVSVVTAVNLAYDMILPRKQQNPLSGIMLLNDSRDCSTKPEMALVMTRAEAIHIPIQSIGWGEAHNPTSLWQLSNHTGGTYSFVRDHNSIKEAIAGCVGGMLSVGMSNARVSITMAEKKWFKMKRVSGISHVISSDGQHADLELGQLRFGERRDVLVEVEMKSARELFRNQNQQTSTSTTTTSDGDLALLGREQGNHHAPIETGTDAFFRNQLGVDLTMGGSLGDVDAFARFYETQFDDMNDDIPLLEVNVSYRDTHAGKNVSRLARPAVLNVTVTPSIVDMPGGLPTNEPSIVKRRVELLTSDSLSRVLLLVSRRMDQQGLRLMKETRRIVSTLMTNLFRMEASNNPEDATEMVGRRALAVMMRLIGRGQMKPTTENVDVFMMLAGCLQVLQRMIEGLEEIARGLDDVSRTIEAQYPSLQQQMYPTLALRAQEDLRNQVYLRFETGIKNFAAEQSGILRDQKAWLIHSIDSTTTTTTTTTTTPSLQSSPNSNNHLNLQQHQHRKLDEVNLSIIEEIYLRSDYSIWMKNMMEHWMPERY